jgi:3-dehydroquinate synthase
VRVQDLRLDAQGFVSVVSFHDGFRLPRPATADRLLYVFDENTGRLFGSDERAAAVIPAGEAAKSWPSVEIILERAIALGLTRGSAIVGVGGGVVCDVAAFAASIYMRGCGLILAPTTLLAMVDAAIGGKTGINFGGFKNMVGTFRPAAEVHVGIAALSSLPEREYHSGLAEVIKTAALGDEELFGLLERERTRFLGRDAALLGEAVRRCAAVKVRIVQEDLTERGPRARLNLGHTFGHALESVTGMERYTHGEAVAWGMARAMELGMRIGLTRPAWAARMATLLEAYGFRTRIGGVDAGAILEAMGRDKKKLGGGLRFVLQEDICRTRVEEVDLPHVSAVLG